MKLIQHTFLCLVSLFFSVSNSFADEVSFNGQFPDGNSWTDPHFFTLTEDSSIEVMINSSCNVKGMELDSDPDGDGTFQGGITDGDAGKAVWHGVYPLAGGQETSREYRYRIQFRCSGHNNEDYTITVRYTDYDFYVTDEESGASQLIAKDEEPNNLDDTATDLGQVTTYEPISGHLGFYYDTGCTNYCRDDRDFYTVSLDPGTYTLEMMGAGDALSESTPNVAIRKDDGTLLLYEPLVKGAAHEFQIDTSDSYSIQIYLGSIPPTFLYPYGGYALLVSRNDCGLKLEDMQMEDNVCGNTETVYAQLRNSCSHETWTGSLRLNYSITGPAYSWQLARYPDNLEILPGKSYGVGWNWEIPTDLFTGNYTACIEVYEEDIQGEYLLLDRICKDNWMLCSKSVAQAGLMLLLLEKGGGETTDSP